MSIFEDYFENCIKNSVKETDNTTLIAFDENKICGYLQYFYKQNEDAIYWSELEIESNHMNDHFTFSLLIKSAIIDENYIKIEKFTQLVIFSYSNINNKVHQYKNVK